MAGNDAELENCVTSGGYPALAECVLIYLFGQSGHFFLYLIYWSSRFKRTFSSQKWNWNEEREEMNWAISWRIPAVKHTVTSTCKWNMTPLKPTIASRSGGQEDLKTRRASPPLLSWLILLILKELSPCTILALASQSRGQAVRGPPNERLH